MRINREHKPNLSNTKSWHNEEDFICDICEKSCAFHTHEDIDGNKYHQFEYASLVANWGYGPEWDGDIWESHICVDCVKAHIMPLMRINCKSYMFSDETGYYKDGEYHMFINGVELAEE